MSMNEDSGLWSLLPLLMVALVLAAFWMAVSDANVDEGVVVSESVRETREALREALLATAGEEPTAEALTTLGDAISVAERILRYPRWDASGGDLGVWAGPMPNVLISTRSLPLRIERVHVLQPALLETWVQEDSSYRPGGPAPQRLRESQRVVVSSDRHWAATVSLRASAPGSRVCRLDLMRWERDASCVTLPSLSHSSILRISDDGDVDLLSEDGIFAWPHSAEQPERLAQAGVGPFSFLTTPGRYWSSGDQTLRRLRDGETLFEGASGARLARSPSGAFVLEYLTAQVRLRETGRGRVLWSRALSSANPGRPRFEARWNAEETRVLIHIGDAVTALSLSPSMAHLQVNTHAADLDFGPNGRLAVVSDTSGASYLAAGEEMRAFDEADALHAVRFLRADRLLLFGDHVRLVDAQTGALIVDVMEMGFPIPEFVRDEDGERFWVRSADRAEVRSVDDGQLIAESSEPTDGVVFLDAGVVFHRQQLADDRARRASGWTFVASTGPAYASPLPTFLGAERLLRVGDAWQSERRGIVRRWRDRDRPLQVASGPVLGRNDEVFLTRCGSPFRNAVCVYARERFALLRRVVLPPAVLGTDWQLEMATSSAMIHWVDAGRRDWLSVDWTQVEGRELGEIQRLPQGYSVPEIVEGSDAVWVQRTQGESSDVQFSSSLGMASPLTFEVPGEVIGLAFDVERGRIHVATVDRVQIVAGDSGALLAEHPLPPVTRNAHGPSFISLTSEGETVVVRRGQVSLWNGEQTLRRLRGTWEGVPERGLVTRTRSALRLFSPEGELQFNVRFGWRVNATQTHAIARSPGGLTTLALPQGETQCETGLEWDDVARRMVTDVGISDDGAWLWWRRGAHVELWDLNHCRREVILPSPPAGDRGYLLKPAWTDLETETIWLAGERGVSGWPMRRTGLMQLGCRILKDLRGQLPFCDQAAD